MSAPARAPPSTPVINAAHGLGDYVRHRPEDTILFDIVRDHLAEFLSAAREHNERPLPRYVEDEFRKYLRCGLLAHGFLRAYCAGCGADVLVAFSCKNRGVCPSCAARRMCATAAQIADDVLPAVPLRQWVITLPFELRMIVATRADAMTAVLRIAIEEIRRAYRERAKSLGVTDPRTGAITFIHRFGGSLNLNTHFHVASIDGVYADGAARFEPAAPPSHALLHTVAERIHKRVVRWAGRYAKRMGAEGESLGSGLENAGVQRGLFATLDERGRLVEDDDAARFDPRTDKLAATYEGFSVHAGVTVAAWDADGRERLCRYGARPPFSLARLSRLDDGRIAYRTKYPGPHGHTHRVMSPIEFLARIAATIPPPRYPLVRYHGVLAPNAKLRSKVVPRSEDRPRGCAQRQHPSPAPDHRARLPPPTQAIGAQEIEGRESSQSQSQRPAVDNAALTPLALANATPPMRTAPPVARADCRPMDRINWADLLRRIYDVDALRCPRCEGRLRFIAVVTERSSIRRVLDHLGESATGPPPGRVVGVCAG